MDKRFKVFLEEYLADYKSRREDGYYPSRTDVMLKEKAMNFLEEDEIGDIYMAFSFYIRNSKYLKKLENIVKNKDKAKLVSNYHHNNQCAKYIDKYWNEMDILFERLEYIISIVKDKTKEELKKKSFSILIAENLKKENSEEEEKENEQK